MVEHYRQGGSQAVVSARLAAVAAELPPAIRTSAELEEMVDSCSPDYAVPSGIVRLMTGIQSRRVAGDEVNASDLAAAAVKRLLAQSETPVAAVDLLIFASASQDLLEPATANIVSHKTGLKCPVMDIKNACNSFINGLQVAEALIAQGGHRCAVVCAGEVPSRAIKVAISDRDDFRLSFPGYTFGDAGAAALLVAADDERGIFYRKFRTHSEYWDVGTLAGGGTMHPRGDEWSYFRGDGTRLRDAFVAVGPDLLTDALAATGTTLDDYRRVFVHQVTMPFLRTFQCLTGIPDDKLVITLPELGNMAAASMPVQCSLAMERHDLQSGDKVAWIGLAGGINLGVMLMEL
jgi:3-oxoacyl-[acyl-carrier-protein] synthase-3